jgi:endo-1,4-beta-xylanase
LPAWLKDGNYSKEELSAILQEYVTTVAAHYKGKVYIWSIANESAGGSIYGGDFFQDKLGPAYIENSFRWAQEADPDALLMLNEIDNHSMVSEKAVVFKKMYSLVEDMKNKGVKIDVVGMQMHLYPQSLTRMPASKQEVIDAMRAFSALGVRIHITEFDVNLHYINASEQEEWQYQASIYQEMLEACLESGVCDGFSLFGVADHETWYRPAYGMLDADPLLFDREYNPKPAYFAIFETLGQ